MSTWRRCGRGSVPRAAMGTRLGRGAIALGLTALVAACAWVRPEATQPGAGSAEPVLRSTLPNGLHVVIVPNPLAPVATTVVNYRVGSNEAPKGFPGMAHAQEHMMFRGSPGLSAGQLAAVTAAMGGDFDADTQQTVTQYFFTVPSEDLDVALHIEAIRMRGVLDSPSLWKRERGAIEQEVAQDLSNPEYVFYKRLLARMFRGTPYAHDALGTRPSFQRTTADALRRFHGKWYAPNNATLVIAGDVDPKAALAEVKRLFGDIPRKVLPPRPAVRLSLVQPEILRLKTDRPYGIVAVSFRMPGYRDADYAAAQVLADALSSRRGRFYDLVVSGQALDVGFDFDPLPEAGLGYAVAIFPKGADANALLAKVRGVITDAVKHGVPPDLVEAAKRREVAQAGFQKNSISGLAMAWSQALAVEGRESPEDDVRAIEHVSAADVDRVARTRLELDHAVSAILTPEASGKPVASGGFGGPESFAPEHVGPVTLPDWAKKALSRLRIPSSTVHPVVTRLSNGLRLIVQPERVSNTVSVYGRIRTTPSLETPHGQEGVDEVLDQLFSYGTTSLDRVAFQKQLDAIGAEESAGADFSVRVLADHFDRGLALLADNELHPALPQRAFETVRRQVAATVAGRRESPGWLAHRALHKALFPKGDPALREATRATVSKLSRKDVVAYYRHAFRPDLTTIVVIGNVDPGVARRLVEREFGSWSASGPRPDTLLPPVPPNRPSATQVPDASRVQDRVTLAETLQIHRSDPDYYALELGNHVLGGAFYATRLYRDLRERTGLVYYVGSSFDVGRTRAVYSVDYACDPPNVSKARAIIVRDLEAMRRSPVSADELHQAKALLLREIPLSESSVGAIAGGLLHRATHDLPLDEPTRAARRYVALDARAVQEAFVHWLRPKDLVQITQGPTPR